MGAKGRDALLWFYAFIVVPAFVFKALAFLPALLTIVLFWHYYVERPRTRIDLGHITLLPINRHWSKCLVRGRINGRWKKAYEIHLTQTHPSFKEMRGICRDLKWIYDNMTGLFLWEGFWVPRNIQGFIDEAKKKQLVFTKKGHLLPRFPFVNKYKTDNSGGFLLQGKE